MTNLFDLTDRVIAVTGAGGVLAGQTAQYLTEQGARVAFLDRDQSRLDEAVAKVSVGEDRILAVACDVLEEDSVKGAYEQTIAKFGRVDALINGAGGNMPGATISPGKTIFDLALGDYKKVLDLNLMGSVLPTVTFADAFAKQKSGSVINFSSMASGQAITRVLGYSNAKAAIDNFTKWMAVEFARTYGGGLRVNAIAPGFFISNQNRALLTNEDGSFTDRGQKVIDNTPFGRFGETDEVFGTIHFLLSDAAQFVTGTVIPVDGGFSIFSGV